MLVLAGGVALQKRGSPETSLSLKIVHSPPGLGWLPSVQRDRKAVFESLPIAYLDLRLASFCSGKSQWGERLLQNLLSGCRSVGRTVEGQQLSFHPADLKQQKWSFPEKVYLYHQAHACGWSMKIEGQLRQLARWWSWRLTVCLRMSLLWPHRGRCLKVLITRQVACRLQCPFRPDLREVSPWNHRAHLWKTQ